MNILYGRRELYFLKPDGSTLIDQKKKQGARFYFVEYREPALTIALYAQ